MLLPSSSTKEFCYGDGPSGALAETLSHILISLLHVLKSSACWWEADREPTRRKKQSRILNVPPVFPCVQLQSPKFILTSFALQLQLSSQPVSVSSVNAISRS